MEYQEAYRKLEEYGQLHVLKYYDELSGYEKEALLEQIDNTDFRVLEKCLHREELNPRGEITPIEVMQLEQIDKRREEFTRIGLDAIRAGKVGAVLLAGGMGTRLGSDAPKGVYNIGLTKDVFIFQRLVENLLEVVRQNLCGVIRAGARFLFVEPDPFSGATGAAAMAICKDLETYIEL